MNQGLRPQIFKSGFVIAGGQEGEQMLRSFNHACHAPDCSLAAELAELHYCHPFISVACTLSLSLAVCVGPHLVCVCRREDTSGTGC